MSVYAGLTYMPDLCVDLYFVVSVNLSYCITVEIISCAGTSVLMLTTVSKELG